jgi:prepilin-type N-terminal cleavage/methylation domain-containing protein
MGACDPRDTIIYHDHGLTLVELCIAVMIAAMLAVVAVPSFSSMLGLYRLNGATAAVWGDLHKARLMAIKEQRTIRVDFTPTSYSLVRAATGQVAFTRNLATEYPGVTLSVATNSLTFRSSGFLDHDNRPVDVQGASKMKRFTVLATGNIGHPS